MNIPAFVVGGTTSGSGKTTITLGIMAALKRRGFNVQPFKCGPDFIDPTLHMMVTGNVSRNLDLRMAGIPFCQNSFSQNIKGMDVAVIEGVMGLFDGGTASSAALAETLSLPVVLVIDARSAAESVAAVLKGFEVYDQNLKISGVIFNRVGSSRHKELISDAVSTHCNTTVLGFFPRDIEFSIPERHLGLFMGEETPLGEEQINNLIRTVEKNINVDRLLRLNMTSIDREVKASIENQDERVTLAVARDQAFCFYYQDNFDLFFRAGIDIIYFSPMNDSKLPEKIDGIYIGGGYPEIFAEILSKNKKMMNEIRAWADRGGPLFCECGGFMYMCHELVNNQGDKYQMTGVFPATILMNDRLSRLGYREVKIVDDCLLGKPGDTLFGHEFHYSAIQEIDPAVPTVFELQDGRREGYVKGNVLGGYVHFHFGRSEKGIDSLYNSLKLGKGNATW